MSDPSLAAPTRLGQGAFGAFFMLCFALALSGCGGGGAESPAQTPAPVTSTSGTTTGGSDMTATAGPTPAGTADAGVPNGSDVGASAAEEGDAGVPADGGPTAAATDAGAQAQPDPQAAWHHQVLLGRIVFNRVCDSCHPGGDEDLGPRIIGKRLPAQRVIHQIRHGSGHMRPIPASKLPDRYIPDLLAYLSVLHVVQGVSHP